MAKIETKKIEWNAPENIKAYITTRIGGSSKDRYQSSNMSADVGDLKTAVNKNREDIRKSLSLPSDPSFMKQIHGTNIEYLITPKKNIICDGSYTDRKEVVLAVLSADCLPILFTNTTGTIAGVLHVGWRGLHKNLIEKFIKKMKIDPSEIIVSIGPSISQKHYQVREDVYIKLKSVSPNIFKKLDDLHWSLNLASAAKIILTKIGINKIFINKFCTYECANLYYSFRRENITGRMASLIWIE